MNTIVKPTRTPEHFAQANVSWQSIKNAIGAENYHNPTYLGLLYFVRDAILATACFGALYFAESWYYVVPLWFLSALLISGLFVIGHDASHGALFENRTLAHWVCQICMLPALHPYAQWSYGHNRVHHGRTVELGSDPVWHPTSPAEYLRKTGFQRLVHRFYWSAAGAGFYYLIEIWIKKLLLDPAHQRNKGALRDKILLLGFAVIVSGALVYGGAAGGAASSGVESGDLSATDPLGASLANFDWLAGLWMWAKVMLVPFMLWNYLAGIVVYMQHISDVIPWQRPGEWSPEYGQLFGTVNFHVPFFINFFVHNIFIHVPHHVQVRIPFYHLKRALEDIKARYGEFVLESRTPVRDYFRMTARCKLFDPVQGRWYRYRDIGR